MKRWISGGIALLIGAGLIAWGIYTWQQRSLEYTDCLDKTAFTLNGQERSFADLGFYIMYEELEVELLAQIYNPSNTRDYWNLHIDGVFISVQAKNTVMEMAIHDELFYQLAMEAGIELTPEEEIYLANSEADFWMDLLDEQLEKQPVSDEYISGAIRRKAYAEKYQAQLAEETGHTYASYNWDGYYYGLLLEQQELSINSKIWDKISVGNITLNHGSANYINGLED